MSQRDGEDLNSPKVIALAAAAASAAAGLAVALARRRSAPPPPKGVQALLADPRVQSAAEIARASLEQARARATGPEAEALKRDVLQRVGQAVDAARSELPPLARQATEAAMVAADRLRSEGAVRSADLGERLKSDVAPAARTLAQDAISEAEEILAAARERALELGETARKDYVPQLGSQTAALGGVAARVVTGLGDSLGKMLGETMKSRRLPVRTTSPASRVAAATGGALQAAGGQAKYVVGETLMIGVWAGALGGVVYYGLLRPAQRERVRAFFGGMVSQARGLMGDLRAPDEDFAPGGE